MINTLIINYLYFYEMRKVSRFGKLCKIAAYTKGLKTSAICLTLSGRLCKSGMVHNSDHFQMKLFQQLFYGINFVLRKGDVILCPYVAFQLFD